MSNVPKLVIARKVSYIKWRSEERRHEVEGTRQNRPQAEQYSTAILAGAISADILRRIVCFTRAVTKILHASRRVVSANFVIKLPTDLIRTFGEDF